MPELPEVETVRRGLERELVGKRIKSVEVTGMRSIRRHKNKNEFAGRLEGVKVKSVKRRGKYLVIHLDSSELLVVHMRMSGQLRRAQPKDPLDKHTHVVITFTQGGQLRFVDPRTFGEMFLTAPDVLSSQIPELADLGFDPVDEPLAVTEFARRLLGRPGVKLKTLLMDQSFMAGVGNIYSDEILWESGLRFDRTPSQLSNMEIRRLFRAIVEILHEGIKHRGSTLADQQYVDVAGKPGDYQQFHAVYDRTGLACRRCRGIIAREKFAGRSTFFCPDCQV
ncbi:MAG: bifunctional DNA-formamidopyrimidine glycosylase/DNA-(apurinic or apyrimidinic site) lyase [Actinomycetota bacterium]|nr:bifunctional DNA-formamidopyrimidine glycosylase/DNA-(apurinic or apyrimidinic site) lyase [Acidimicrobiia bacterium]MDQ3293739.1 bifunctional DNA-formamidopyrimidine glycosylase/DNA-(apurinic or apyrimidinic site) lyase [Actinomycetota bacterium]